MIPYNLIHTLGALKLLKKGCQGYLVVVKDAKSLKAILAKVLVVNEFEDVFPIELLELPRPRDRVLY